jgi:hypothetical protein
LLSYLKFFEFMMRALPRVETVVVVPEIF